MKRLFLSHKSLDKNKGILFLFAAVTLAHPVQIFLAVKFLYSMPPSTATLPLSPLWWLVGISSFSVVLGGMCFYLFWKRERRAIYHGQQITQHLANGTLASLPSSVWEGEIQILGSQLRTPWETVQGVLQELELRLSLLSQGNLAKASLSSQHQVGQYRRLSDSLGKTISYLELFLKKTGEESQTFCETTKQMSDVSVPLWKDGTKQQQHLTVLQECLCRSLEERKPQDDLVKDMQQSLFRLNTNIPQCIDRDTEVITVLQEVSHKLKALEQILHGLDEVPRQCKAMRLSLTLEQLHLPESQALSQAIEQLESLAKNSDFSLEESQLIMEEVSSLLYKQERNSISQKNALQTLLEESDSCLSCSHQWAENQQQQSLSVQQASQEAVTLGKLLQKQLQATTLYVITAQQLVEQAQSMASWETGFSLSHTGTNTLGYERLSPDSTSDSPPAP